MALSGIPEPGQPAIDALIRGLDHHDSDVIGAAVAALLKHDRFNSNKCMELVSAFQGGEFTRRLLKSAVGDLSAWPDLAAAWTGLLASEVGYIRQGAARVLTQLKPDTPGLTEAWTGLLASENGYIRLEAAWVLTELKRDTSGLSEAWTGLLASEDEYIRLDAARVLAKIKPDTPGLYEAWTGLLASEDKYIRLNAARVLPGFETEASVLAEKVEELCRKLTDDDQAQNSLLRSSKMLLSGKALPRDDWDPLLDHLMGGKQVTEDAAGARRALHAILCLAIQRNQGSNSVED